MKNTKTTAATPGPWVYGPSAHEDAEFVVGIAQPDMRGEGYNPQVALIRNSKAALANARLIAAAPALLEALQAAEVMLSAVECDGVKHIGNGYALDQARTALNLAKGGE